jgi:hypothetical protein
MKKQFNLDGLRALLTENAAKARQAERAAKARQAERVRAGHDSGDCAPFALNEFPYLQLADRLEKRIRKGEFGEDGKLPVTGELADWYDVGVGVIKHARQELMRRNLVVFRLGHGYFARKSTPGDRCPHGPSAEGAAGQLPACRFRVRRSPSSRRCRSGNPNSRFGLAVRISASERGSRRC